MRMKVAPIVKDPSAFLPIVMSLGALAHVLVFLALRGPAPQPDEGAAAHIWQLLIAGQVPVIVWFIARWVFKSPRQALAIVALQVVAALGALAPVFLLHW